MEEYGEKRYGDDGDGESGMIVRYWVRIVKLFEEGLLRRKYICPSDLAFFERVCSVDAAVEKIGRFYRRYHSSRYVDNRLMIRLTSQLSPEDIQKPADRFRDIIVRGGSIAASVALEAEADDAEVTHLPRLVIDFNRRDFGRLRSLIDAINDF